MMDSSQVFLAKSILRELIHDIDLDSPFHGEKAFAKFVWEKLLAGLANYAARLLARQQLLWQIQCRGNNHEIWFGDADLQSVITATGG